jgi:hypothetical protein
MARTSRKGTGSAFRDVTDAAEKRRKARQSPLEQFAGRTAFEWEDVSAAAVCDGINHACTRGATITFSLTRDGGAVHITMWLDNRKSEAYAGNAETLNELLEALAEVEDIPTDD